MLVSRSIIFKLNYALVDIPIIVSFIGDTLVGSRSFAIKFYKQSVVDETYINSNFSIKIDLIISSLLLLPFFILN